MSRKLASVLDAGGSATPTAASIADDQDEPRQVKAATKSKVTISQDDDDEEAMSYFKKIAMEE